MALVHEALYRSDDLSHIRSRSALGRSDSGSAASLRGLADVQVTISVHVEDAELTADAAINSGLILNEILTNSLKHAFSGEGRR